MYEWHPIEYSVEGKIKLKLEMETGTIFDGAVISKALRDDIEKLIISHFKIKKEEVKPCNCSGS